MHIPFNLTIMMDHKPVIVLGQIDIGHTLWHNHILYKYDVKGMPMSEMIIFRMVPSYTDDNSRLNNIVVWLIETIHFLCKTINTIIYEKPIAVFKNHILKDREHVNNYVNM